MNFSFNCLYDFCFPCKMFLDTYSKFTRLCNASVHDRKTSAIQRDMVKNIITLTDEIRKFPRNYRENKATKRH